MKWELKFIKITRDRKEGRENRKRRKSQSQIPTKHDKMQGIWGSVADKLGYPGLLRP